jgi:integrase
VLWLRLCDFHLRCCCRDLLDSQVNVRKRVRRYANGRKQVTWQMDYIDPDTGERLRPTLPVDNQKDAERVAATRWREIVLQHELGEDADPTEGEKRVTLAELLAQDLERPGVAAHTKRMERYRHETLKRILGADRKITELRTMMLVKYQSARSKDVANSTINDELAILHAAIKRAKKHKLITRLPCEFPDKLPEQEPRRRFLLPDQIEALLRALPLETRDIAEFIYRMGGMRPGEVWKLRWSDVDIARGTITIAGTKRGTSLKVRHRTLPLSERAFAILKRRVDPKAPAPKPTDLVFGRRPEDRQAKFNSRGKKLGHYGGVLCFDDWKFNDKLKKAAELAEIPHPETVTAYVLRHSAATNATGADITDVAYMLGHSDPRMTMQVYRHARADRVHAGLDSLQGHPEGTGKVKKKRAA